MTERVEPKGTSGPVPDDVQDAQADLTRLHQDVVEAEERLVEAHTAELVEANEQLVVATLRARSDAATCAEELKDATLALELDALTALPNRALMLDRFKQALANARRHETRLALLFLDLDNFKQINDTLGHGIGDEALKLAAQGIASSVRDADTVSRHGGDEFLILLAEVSRGSDAILVADKVIAALEGPHHVGEHVVRLTASIGISMYPDDGEDASTLIDRADAAMYLAKRQGRGTVVVHGQGPSKGPDS